MGQRDRIKDHIILCIGAVILTLPLWLVFMAASRSGPLSLVPGDGASANFDQLQRTLEAAGPTLTGMLWVSGVTALGVAALATAVSFMAGFAMVFARVPDALFWVSLATLYFPIEARMIPTFEIVAALGLHNTTAGLIFPILPVAIGTFAFRQHLRTIAPEIMEAARLDGAGPAKFMLDFAVPLSWPMIGAVFSIAFTLGWNQYLWPLMVSVDNTQFTLMRGFGLTRIGSGASFALAAISLVPPLVLVTLAVYVFRKARPKG